jgi:hypothetical protein
MATDHVGDTLCPRFYLIWAIVVLALYPLWGEATAERWVAELFLRSVRIAFTQGLD